MAKIKKQIEYEFKVPITLYELSPPKIIYIIGERVAVKKYLANTIYFSDENFEKFINSSPDHMINQSI